MTVVLRLNHTPNQRLDLMPLRPDALARMDEAEIARIAVGTTRERLTVGDLFTVEVGVERDDHVVIVGGSERFDNVGMGMGGGTLHLQGDAGNYAGCAMTGGQLTVEGSVGHWTGSGMKGGTLVVTGSAGDRLGGARPGETQGMDGGVLVVRGNAGDRTGDRQRRGIIVVEGGAGADTASRMLAGTLVVCGATVGAPGYLMRRGTVVLGTPCTMAATFTDAGAHDLVIVRLLRTHLRPHSAAAATLLAGPLRRFAGDMAVLGKGEIFCAIQAG